MPEPDFGQQSAKSRLLIDQADYLNQQSRENRKGVKLNPQLKAEAKTRTAQELKASNEKINRN